MIIPKGNILIFVFLDFLAIRFEVQWFGVSNFTLGFTDLMCFYGKVLTNSNTTDQYNCDEIDIVVQ